MQKHILVIDDEQDVLDVMGERLVIEGFLVSTARTAEEARRIIPSGPLHLVISDLQLEDTDGLVLADELRKRLPDVPILLLTGTVFDHEVVRDVIQRRFTSYLDKTTPLSRILAEVHRLTDTTQQPKFSGRNEPV